ncbi:MAG: hypothetical protein EBV20_07415 [Betaproteobacteria bacterium]|jgi:hypothetical protein|nr:hypothetical protein [Betaproteobacteria bacterium]NBP44460.1 hypothetical protein [Betaproteobacteria bacterium]
MFAGLYILGASLTKMAKSDFCHRFVSTHLAFINPRNTGALLELKLVLCVVLLDAFIDTNRAQHLPPILETGHG